MDGKQKVTVNTQHKPVFVVQINRPEVRNAVDGDTARLLHDAFIQFAEDDEFRVAILTGSGGNFCAGADLRAISNDKAGPGLDKGATANALDVNMDHPGPMGPTRLALPKPVIASIDGYAVAGGLELAAWSDLRVASRAAQLGVLCRLRGVPLIDGGTFRLPRLIGLSRAQDLMLTGRLISAAEAERMGLVNVVVDSDSAEDVFQASLKLAQTISQHPQECMRGDRLSALSLSTKHGGEPQQTFRNNLDGMSLNGSNPWQPSSSSSSQAQQRANADGRNFPPLGAKGPSKAQQRARAVYMQSSNFEPYPPRIDQLTRQELSRLDSEHHYTTDVEIEDDVHENSPPGYIQRSGMSSVTIYDENGQCLSRGPDIYRRLHSFRGTKGSEKSKISTNGKGNEREGKSSLQAAKSFVTPGDLPSAFTDEKLTTLMRECERRQRVQAAEERLKSATMIREDANQPLKNELLKAFSSIEAFKAAFAKQPFDGEKAEAS